MLAVAALLLAGCGGGGDGSGASIGTPAAASAGPSSAGVVASPSGTASSPTGADSSTAGPATSTAGPATSTAGPATSTPTDAPATEQAASDSPCPASASNLDPDLASNAQRVEEAVGDLDGDDRPDRLVTYKQGDQGSFFFRVVLATGYVVEAPLDQASDMAPVKPLGATTIGADRQVAFVVEQAGASTANLSLWAMPDYPDQPCGLSRVTIADPTSPTLFPVGGSAGAGSGLQCRDMDGDGATDLVVRSISAEGDDTYSWSEQGWHWPGQDALRGVGQADGTFHEPDDHDEIGSFHSFDCPGVPAP